MLRRSRLLTEFSKDDSKLAFYGGLYNKGRRRDILKKPTSIPTSAGTKELGFGDPHTGRRIRMIPRGGGELITHKHAPTHPNLKRGKSPHREAARKKRSYIGASLDLDRSSLLIDS